MIFVDEVWTDSESSVDEEETYSISYKEIWDKIKVSEDLIQLFESVIASAWDLEEDLDDGVPE